LSLSAAQKSYINHLVIKHHDDSRNIEGGSMSDALYCREVLKCHPNTVVNWKKNPEFKEALERAIQEYEEGHDYFKTILHYKALEELWLQYTKATGTDKRHYLSMILDQTKDVEQYSETTNYDAMTNEQLAQIYLNRDFTLPEGLSVSQLKKLSKGAN
jgi:hypothetical protein